MLLTRHPTTEAAHGVGWSGLIAGLVALCSLAGCENSLQVGRLVDAGDALSSDAVPPRVPASDASGAPADAMPAAREANDAGAGGGDSRPENALRDVGPTVAPPGDAAPDDPPEPANGAGLSDPPTKSLHGHGCGGVDWQRIHGWLLLPHAAPEVGPAEEMERCVARYAGWVTHAADDAGLSRASLYAGLAAHGLCDADRAWGAVPLTGPQCVAVNPALDEAECLRRMATSPAFGIATLARRLGAREAVRAHDRDIPLMGAYLGQGEVACGGGDRWRLRAPQGFVDRYVAAYNALKARSAEPPDCRKRIVVTVALYTGLDTPGVDDVRAANGCWTYERVAKENAEWRICNYDGTVHHRNGTKWAYDDTNTAHDRATDRRRIEDCQAGVEGRGYVYMTNRGSGWPFVVRDGVDAHFAEIYSSQYTVDDQYDTWVADGTPGYPMINVGEPATSANTIYRAALRACRQVADGGYLGVYIYPESLRDDRMSALVRALDECTGQ